MIGCRLRRVCRSTVGNYQLFYEPTADGIRLLRVYHACAGSRICFRELHKVTYACFAGDLLFGTLFIAALVLWCWLDANVTRPGAFLLPLALMLSWLGAEELLAMFNKRGRYPLPWVVYAGVLLTVLLSGMPIVWPGVVDLTSIGRLGWLAIGLMSGLMFALIGELPRYGGQWHSTLNVGLSMLAITYIGGLMAFIVQLRLLGGDDRDGSWECSLS